jgi:hypothetical protein
VIESEEEFSHDGGESDFARFTFGAEALVKACEDGIVARGAERSHVETAAQRAASAKDGAFAVPAAAVAIKGGRGLPAPPLAAD